MESLFADWFFRVVVSWARVVDGGVIERRRADTSLSKPITT